MSLDSQKIQESPLVTLTRELAQSKKREAELLGAISLDALEARKECQLLRERYDVMKENFDTVSQDGYELQQERDRLRDAMEFVVTRGYRHFGKECIMRLKQALAAKEGAKDE
jgi:predicted  nucleic acid-binding Zn-ribbon protein